jgi:hypothetical protein
VVRTRSVESGGEDGSRVSVGHVCTHVRVNHSEQFPLVSWKSCLVSRPSGNWNRSCVCALSHLCPASEEMTVSGSAHHTM